MDASKLIEIRAREATRIINRSIAVDSSVLTFTKAANTVAASTAAEQQAPICCGSKAGSKGSGAHVPTCDAVLMKNAGCCVSSGQLDTIIANCCPGDRPVVQQNTGPTLPCACVEDRRFVGKECC
jgi:hypothetical protein